MAIFNTQKHCKAFKNITFLTCYLFQASMNPARRNDHTDGCQYREDQQPDTYRQCYNLFGLSQLEHPERKKKYSGYSRKKN